MQHENDLLLQIVQEEDNGDYISWVEVQERMLKCGYDKSKEAWRTQYRRVVDPKFVKENKRGTLLRDLRRRNAMTLSQQLLKLLAKKRSIQYLEFQLKKPRKEILAEIVELQLLGYNGISIWEEDGEQYAANIPTNSSRRYDEHDLSDLYNSEEIVFAVVSDTHLGSHFEALDELHQFYQYVADQKIHTVYHVGDISEGWYTNRPTHIKEVHAVGFTDQLYHIVEHYPAQPDVHTYFITGNHDYTHMRNGFANIGEMIAEMREDMTYLGHNFAKVHLTEDVTMALVHPTDGSAQTLSLKIQKLIDKNQKRRADIMLAGHYHKSVGVKYQGVYGYLVPSFQHQTGFMEDNNLTSDVAGMIFRIKVYQGQIISVITEYVDFT